MTYQFTPSATETYYIAVREDGNNDVGQYFVQADVRVPADNYSADTSTSGHLVEGAAQTANNERDGDSDWIEADLTAGQSYSFYAVDRDATDFDFAGVLWPGWIDDLQVTLQDAQGNVVATDMILPGEQPPEHIAQLSFTPTQSGRYYLTVTGQTASNAYLVGFDVSAGEPGPAAAVLQPDPVAGVDVSFANVRDHLETPGVDSGTLSVGGFWSNGSSGSALRFDLSGLPRDAGYAAIQLYFTGTAEADAYHPPMPMLLGTPKADWDEQSSLGQLGGFDFVKVLAAPDAPGWYSIDITDLYNAWQEGDRANEGIVLLPMDMDASTNLFDSSDNQDAAERPRLVVEQLPPSQIMGTASLDVLTGDAHSNDLYGLEGTDILSGGGGDDWIDGGPGADVIDEGDGIDTASYLNSPAAVQIDLGAKENHGGWAEGDSLVNIEIVQGSAFDDTINGSFSSESLFGEDGNDTLSGGLGADTLPGGAGDDTFAGTAAELDGDTITDLAPGDHIHVTDATLAGFGASLAGTALTFTGGALTLANAPTGHLVVSADAFGGVDLALARQPAANDFDGDGRSDILWRNDSGQAVDWLASGGGNFVGGADLGGVATAWHVAGTGDFDGDGKADLVWRNDNGDLVDWLATSNGGFAGNTDFGVVPTAWHVQANVTVV